MADTQAHTQTTWQESVKIILTEQLQHNLFFVKKQ